MRPDIPSANAERTCPRCGLVFFSEKLDAMCPSCLLSHSLDGEDLGDGPAFWEDAPERPLAPARTFSHFELLDELGRGGMGVVYRARDLNTERIVALKVLQAHHLDVPDLVQRFRSEVRAVSSLDHPYVLPIHEVGEHDGIPFFSMKLTTAGSLAQSIVNYRGKPRESAQLLAKVARGVQHAHERGILHRDLKPGNILLDAAGEPYVCDFGLAKWIESDQKLTVTSAVLGTPHYIAPEQALGSKALTTAVDIYSLGAILYELLTGRPPFLGATVLETLVASQEKTPDRPSSIAKNVPADLETICLKALEHEPSSRYATAGAFADDLENWLAGRAITARPVSAAEQLWRWAKRNPLPALLVAALIGTLAIIAVGSALTVVRIKHEMQRAILAELDAKDKLYDSLLAQSRAFRLSGGAGQRFDSLEVIRQAAKIRKTLPLRNEAIAALLLLDLKTEKTLPVRQRGQVPPVFSEDLETVISEGTSGRIKVTRVSDGMTIADLGDSDLPAEFLANWKSKLIAVRYKGGIIRIWDLPKQKILSEITNVPRTMNPNWISSDFGISSDGKVLWVSSTSKGLSTYRCSNGEKICEYPLDFQPGALSLSPDGKYILVTFPNEALVSFWDTEKKSIFRSVRIPAPAWTGGWSPNGKTLALGCRDFNIYLINLETGKNVGTLVGHRQEVTQVSFSHSGRILASTSRDRTVRLWSLCSLSQEVLASGLGGQPSLQFSKNDEFLSTCSFGAEANILRIGGLERICETVTPLAPQRAMLVSSVDISPDGSKILSASYESIDILDRSTLSVDKSISYDSNEYRAAKIIDEDTILAASISAGIATYSIAAVDNHAAPLATHVLVSGTGFTLGTSLETDKSVLSIINRDRGDISAFRLDTSEWTPIASNRPNIQDAVINLRDNWAVLTFSAVTSSTTGNAEVWSIGSRKLLHELPTGQAGVAAISPDRRYAAITGGEGCTIWDTIDWHLIKRFPSFGYVPKFSPKWPLLAVSSNEEIEFIDTNTFNVVAELRPPLIPSVSHRLSFSKSGETLVAQGADGTIRILNLTKLLQELKDLGLNW